MTHRDSDLIRLEVRISIFLRYGVLTAAALLALGWTFLRPTDGAFLSAFSSYHPAPLATVLSDAWQTSDWGMLVSYSGLIVLISLPILRVLMTAVLFWRQNERTMALLATMVLLSLIGGFFLGVGH
jgi:uncharacterized membrane protein